MAVNDGFSLMVFNCRAALLHSRCVTKAILTTVCSGEHMAAGSGDGSVVDRRSRNRKVSGSSHCFTECKDDNSNIVPQCVMTTTVMILLLSHSV